MEKVPEPEFNILLKQDLFGFLKDNLTIVVEESIPDCAYEIKLLMINPSTGKKEAISKYICQI